MEETYNNEARERFSLKEQIKELVERSESIGAEAKQLTHALRGDSKIQGDWGEMILESILENRDLKRSGIFHTGNFAGRRGAYHTGLRWAEDAS